MIKTLDMFNRVTDSRIRNRNRAVIMANLFEDNMEDKSSTTSQRGAALVLKYFNNIPDEDKDLVFKDYETVMSERGYVGVQ